jgi:hypothetical protein
MPARLNRLYPIAERHQAHHRNSGRDERGRSRFIVRHKYGDAPGYKDQNAAYDADDPHGTVERIDRGIH